MAHNLKDILSHLSTDIDQETLMLYLQGQLSQEKKHEIEKQLLDNEFASDALEGLQDVKDKQQIAFMVELLNRDLKKKTEKKKQRLQKMKLKDQPWLYISILIFLLLIILSYFILHRMINSNG
ncbi:MAG TPA: hypothetical protein VF487_01400 [Chitinophagaceae bacterium]